MSSYFDSCIQSCEYPVPMFASFHQKLMVGITVLSLKIKCQKMFCIFILNTGMSKKSFLLLNTFCVLCSIVDWQTHLAATAQRGQNTDIT